MVMYFGMDATKNRHAKPFTNKDPLAGYMTG
jgi:hypothetical protein